MILEILDDIAVVGSTNTKLELLKAQSNNELLKRIYRLTYHKQINFGIKKIPFFDRNRNAPTVSLTEALDLLEFQLAKRVVTGNAAIELLADNLCEMSGEDAEVIIRIIKRDLECGASSTMANKVWKDLIPKQPQMLAQPYSDKAIAKIKFPAFAQLKADGARCFAEIRGYESYDDVKLISRAGNEYQNIFALKDELMALYRKVVEIYPEGITVDGELVYIAPPKKLSALEFLGGVPESEDTNSVASRSVSNGIANKALKGSITDDEAKNLSFQIWDFYSLDIAYGVENTTARNKPYHERFAELSALTNNLDKMLLIEHHVVDTIEQARAIYNDYLNKGLEGIILKNTNSIWEDKRSVNQVKFKNVIDIDLRVVGFTTHSKDPKKIGSFIFESDDKRIKVKAGSGLRDTDSVKTDELDDNEQAVWVPIPIAERHELNRARLFTEVQDMIDNGTIFELECNGYETSEGRTDTVSLFLPIIKRIRHDKDTTNTFAEKFPESNFFGDLS